MLKVTIITKYDGTFGDIFVAAVSTPLSEITEEQRKKLRQSLDCDGEGETDEDDEDASSLFFREVEVTTFEELKTVHNADQESESDE